MTLRLIALVAALLLGAAIGYADSGDPGQVELKLVETILTGNIGLVLGLGVTVMGVIMFVKGDTGGAVFMVLLGVLITMAPGVYNGLRLIVCPIADSLGGHCGKSAGS